MIGRSAITLAALLLAANAQADTLPTMPRGAVVCDPDPATGERAVIVPPRLETVTDIPPILHPPMEVLLVPPVRGDDGAITTDARIVERAIPVLTPTFTRRQIAEPARVATLSDFAVGGEFADQRAASQIHPASWDEHLQDYVRRLRRTQIGATDTMRFMGEDILTPRVIDLETTDNASSDTPARVIVEPHRITRESEAEAVDAYHAAAREWASSLPDALVCDGSQVMTKPVDLGPMPQRRFDEIGIRRVTQRRRGSVKYYNRAGAEIMP